MTCWCCRTGATCAWIRAQGRMRIWRSHREGPCWADLSSSSVRIAACNKLPSLGKMVFAPKLYF